MSDDLLDDIDLDDDDTEATVTIRRDQLRALRKKAKAADADAKELAALRAERKVRSIPGLDGLNGDQIAALHAIVGPDATDEQITAKATALGFVAEQSEEAESAQEQIANDRLNRAQSTETVTPSATQITPDDAAAWPPDRLLAFRDAHPDLANALLQGEPVARPAGF